MKLLLVEDDAKIAAALERGLHDTGFTVTVAATGDDGLWHATEGSFDAIVLDLLLPGRSGYDVCRELRRRELWTPVLVLTAKAGTQTEREVLDLGADDYLAKPFSFGVLVARLRALARRAAVSAPAPTRCGALELDSARRRAHVDGTPLQLTAREFDVLEFLLRRLDCVASKRELLDGVWSDTFDGDTNIVEVYISRLRRKLASAGAGAAIETARGAGYRLVPT